MIVLNGFASLFLLPGSIVLGLIGISVEEDGGILRSLVNMIVWGLVGLLVVLAVMV